MDNILTTAELKRRGVAAIEEGLKHGPIHIVKRNRTAAVVLSEAQYRRLTSAGKRNSPGMTAARWLLAYRPHGNLSKRQIDQRLHDERNW